MTRPGRVDVDEVEKILRARTKNTKITIDRDL
jgi:hypothetical protein